MTFQKFCLMLACILPCLCVSCGSDDEADNITFGLIEVNDNLDRADAVNITYKLNAPDDWKAVSDASWCKVEPEQGVKGDNKTLKFNVETNTTTETRVAHIVVTTIAEGKIFLRYNITQPGREAVELNSRPVQATMPAALRVYEYFTQIYGQKTLSSTIADVAWNIDEANLVYEATGKYPAIATFDYIHLAWSPANWIDYTDTKVVEDWWNAGGIVSACWHWNVPCTEDDYDDVSKMTCTPGNGKPNSDGSLTTSFMPKNIFVKGTWEQRFADSSLSKMADMLLLLQNKGIPVIWRPLHEAAGNTYADWNTSQQPMAWFWWGRDGADTYVKLWRYMFDYFKGRGINNLIWVFTGDTKDGPFYPGDNYVDIIGCDIYNQLSAAIIAIQYNGVADLYPTKMVTLSEMGSLAKISAQWSAGAHWLYFMPWYHYDAKSLDGHQHADTQWWRDAMNQQFVVTRDQLPSFK